MREHAIANGVLEIHLPKIACGKDCMNWPEVRELLLNVFRNTPLRITVHVLDDEPGLGTQVDHLDSTLSARAGLGQAEGPYEDETSSGERVFSTEAAVVEDPCSEINESRVNHAFKESPPEDTEFGICQPTQSLEQENQPERSPLLSPDETEGSPTHPCENSAPSGACPSRSPPASAPEADDQNASHPNPLKDTE